MLKNLEVLISCSENLVLLQSLITESYFELVSSSLEMKVLKKKFLLMN